MPAHRKKTASRLLKSFAPFTKPLSAYVKARTGWEMFCLGIGFFSLLGFCVLLFLPIGKGPSVYRATAEMPAAGSLRFLETLSHSMALPLDRGPAPQTLIDGAFADALLADIDAATTSINFMVYVWIDGNFSDTVLAHLERRLAAGVEVRVMLDAFGGLEAPSGRFDLLKQHGAKVATFRSLLPLPWTIGKTHKRNHRRSIVIDGRIAYTGGHAVDDVWLGHASNENEWHDLMFRMTGSMAQRLQGTFAETWGAMTGEVLLGDKFFPEAEQGGDIPYVTLSSSPSPDLFEAENFLFLSMQGARRRLWLQTPYFLPDETMRNVLKDKARAGVDVRLILPSEKTGEDSVRWAGQRIYQELMEAGVKIYEYQPTFTHAKFMIEDSLYSVIGSANMDARSRKLNDEVFFGISDAAFAAELERIFQADLAKSKRIDLAEWKKRGPVQRALEWASQVFVQQY